MDQGANSLDRREFLQVGAATAAVLAAGASAGRALAQDDAKPAPAKSAELPTRVLGKTGVKVSILNQGTWQNPALDRLVRYSFANGVRYFDTAKSYGSEPGLSKWFQAAPEVRKQIFLVTKDVPREPKDLLRMLDERLKELKTDYVDLYFMHALGDHDIDREVKWPNDDEVKAVFEKIRKSGKAKFLGFSTHHPRRAEILQNAAKGGYVDAIMLQYSPFLDKDSPLNKAIDACHKQGIGLISMKQIAGRAQLTHQTEPIATVLKNMPELKDKGLTPYQTLLHGIWSDERISSVCVSMRSTRQIEENTAAARNYQPLKQAQLDQLRDAFIAAGPTLCADCDGSCSRAGKTKAALGDLTRFLTYHEHHGYRGIAREQYAKLSDEARDWAGADLDAARAACPHKLDFAKLLPQVDRHLA